VSDHGLTATSQHYCVNTFLEERGLKTLSYPVVFRQGCDVANMMSGNGMTHLYFRHEAGWKHPVDVDYLESRAPRVLRELIQQPAIDMMAVRTRKGGVQVQTKQGRAQLQRQHGAIHYTPQEGDPLGLGPVPRSLTEEESLTQSMQSRFPDAAHQLTKIFESPRSGDLILGATPGYDLRLGYEYPEHRGTHGSLHRDHMIVPILCNHPLQQGPLRSVDVYATTLDLMGRIAGANVEGQSRI
jgi:hypothetical protein